MVKMDLEPKQAAFDFGCLPKTIGRGESTAHSIAIHLNACQSFSAVIYGEAHLQSSAVNGI